MKILASQGGDMTFDKTALIATVSLTVLFLSACTSAPRPPATMTALPECGWLPNCVNTQSGKGVQSAAPLAADESRWQALKKWLGQQADWQIVSEEDNFMQLTVTTPTVGFTDDVQLLFIPSRQLIQVRSSSRLGLSDMGTNGRRVEALRQQLADFD
jgi:uncharacterized protein (DUF1499 family)